MMKPRTSRAINEQTMSARNKSESLTNGPAVQRGNQAQLTNAQAQAQAIRKRRSSINVYDQPSSLNSRLRQLETDMLRLDEDRTKLFDDTHSALAQYELRLNEIHAILKSRQDNVDKYVEDMKLLLKAKEDFEIQAKLLHDKHDRVHEKFMHRETTISREIKLLKNKFELLEKNRQFRSLLQKSSTNDNKNTDDGGGLDLLSDIQRTRSETNSEVDSLQLQDNLQSNNSKLPKGAKNVRIKLSRLNPFHRFMEPVINLGRIGRQIRRKSNRISSISTANNQQEVVTEANNTASSGGGGGGDVSTKMAKRRTRKANILFRWFR